MSRHVAIRGNFDAANQDQNYTSKSNRSSVSAEQRMLYGVPEPDPEPKVFAARIKELDSKRDAMINALELDSMEEKVILRDALNNAGLWPSHFQYARPPAPPANGRSFWNEQDSRALLLIRRVLPDFLFKRTGNSMFPTRSHSGIDNRYVFMRGQARSLPWNRGDDATLLALYDEHGEQFVQVAKEMFVTNPPLGTYDVERIYLAAVYDASEKQEFYGSPGQATWESREEDNDSQFGEKDEDEDGTDTYDNDAEYLPKDPITSRDEAIARTRTQNRAIYSHVQSSPHDSVLEHTSVAAPPSPSASFSAPLRTAIWALDLNLPDKEDLLSAFSRSNILPTRFQHPPPPARNNPRSRWPEQDLRALLLMRRTLFYLTSRQIRSVVCPTRSVDAVRKELHVLVLGMDDSRWDVDDDETLKEMYVEVGEGFQGRAKEMFAVVPEHTDVEIEMCYAGACQRERMGG